MHRVKSNGVCFGGESYPAGALVNLDEYPAFREGLLASGQLEEVSAAPVPAPKKSEPKAAKADELEETVRVERSVIGRIR